MTDYIDRQAAIDAVMILPQKWDGMYIQDLNCRLRDALNALTSAEVEPVKHGRWIKVSDRNYKCSVCSDWWSGEEQEIKTLIYCPNCGAEMANIMDALNKMYPTPHREDKWDKADRVYYDKVRDTE